ncbi:hypothetical protein INT47_009098 [Mucor saturninus]|uniref:Uncharacterized protein n=1 Tax=Mucor saturninus TaxID=64648 RepID=A0A8H7RM02_9FUNG|nr:hypothetical protein INT47_009098 [Mucor saturninus]
MGILYDSTPTEYFISGKKYLVRTQYEKAFAKFLRAAREYHTQSQFHLAVLYEKGLGTDKDFTQALFWYTKSGEYGCYDAQIRMCKVYQEGALGVAKNHALALSWLRELFSMDKSLEYIPGYKSYLFGQIWEEGGYGIDQDYNTALVHYSNAIEEGYTDACLKVVQLYLRGIGVKQDYKKALKILLNSIENGSLDSLAYFLVGNIYENGGYEVDQDLTKAIEYYVKASTLGITKAPFRLALLYYHGQGVPVDHKSALFWFKKSVEIEETSEAQYYMAIIHMEEDGPVMQSYGIALKWLRLSADQDYAQSQYLLGKLYMGDICELKLDPVKALYWLKKSFENGYTVARYEIGLLYATGGDGIEVDYKQAIFFLKDVDDNNAKSSSDIIGKLFYSGGYGIEKDYKQALFWFLNCGGEASTHNFNTIGMMYYEGGFGIQKNLKEALAWFLKAINSNHLESYVSLGILYSVGGYGVNQDYQAAHDYLLEGVDNKIADSTYYLGVLFTSRNDNEQDFKKAFSWFTKSAKYHDPYSQIWIGIYYMKGLGVERNYIEAKLWFEKASENPLGAVAFVHLGWLYHKGLGVPQSYNKAFEMYEIALKAENNDGARRYAYTCLGLLYQNGHGVSQSYCRAKEYFQKAIDLEDEDGYNCMGDVYKHGHGVNVDYNEAFLWYLKCARACDNSLYVCDEGWLNLGIMYLNGLGTDKNVNLALFYLRKALKYGNEEAQPHIRQAIDIQNEMASAPISYISETDSIIQRSLSVKPTADINLRDIEERIAELEQLKILFFEKGSDQDLKVESTTDEGLHADDFNNDEKDPPKFFHVENVCPEIEKFIYVENITIVSKKEDPDKYFHL